MKQTRNQLIKNTFSPRAPPLLPLNHQRLLQTIDSLGQRVEPRWFYRQMYRHFEWDPRAQLPPSIDIYREQSTRPRWPAFEIYRGLSDLRMQSLTLEQTICPLEKKSRRRRHQTT